MAQNDQLLPEVGAEIMLTVTPAAMRTTLFPEQVLVAKPGHEQVELIFLRNELFMPVQQGRVSAIVENQAQIEVTSWPVMTQLTDLGHVRLHRDAALKLWTALAEHLMQHHEIARGALQEALTTVTDGSTSAE